jgi:DinB family protein
MLSVTERFGYLTHNRVKTVELREATLAVDLEAIQLCAGLSEEQLSWSPRPGRWSIAQNLSHLRRTTEVFLPAVDTTLEASRNLKLHSPGPFRLNLYGRLMVWRMESRPILKMRAPKAIRPRLLGSCAAELDHFLIAQAALRQRIEDAEGFHLTAIRFPSPLASCLRVNLLEFFSVCNAHSRRHLRQANQVRRALPSSSLRNRT